MKDQQDGPQRQATQKGDSKKTEKGAHGGGNKYTQSSIGKGFIAIPPITGHTQKQNIDKKK